MLVDRIALTLKFNGHAQVGLAWRGVAWRGVAWRGVAWRDVATLHTCNGRRRWVRSIASLVITAAAQHPSFSYVITSESVRDKTEKSLYTQRDCIEAKRRLSPK